MVPLLVSNEPFSGMYSVEKRWFIYKVFNFIKLKISLQNGIMKGIYNLLKSMENKEIVVHYNHSCEITFTCERRTDNWFVLENEKMGVISHITVWKPDYVGPIDVACETIFDMGIHCTAPSGDICLTMYSIGEIDFSQLLYQLNIMSRWVF
ncbi:MAG: hypothetical protein CMM93_06010 [Rickettsiales bacterium]|nr:hypothetical protein [Rickettsiales bacterium]